MNIILWFYGHVYVKMWKGILFNERYIFTKMTELYCLVYKLRWRDIYLLSELLAQLTTQQATNMYMYVKPAQTAPHDDCSEDLISGETQHFLGLDTTQLQVAKKKE